MREHINTHHHGYRILLFALALALVLVTIEDGLKIGVLGVLGKWLLWWTRHCLHPLQPLQIDFSQPIIEIVLWLL